MGLPLRRGSFLRTMNDDWKRFASALKDEMMFEKIDPKTKQRFWFSLKYQQTMYESPKKYRNDYAFNTDGTWLKFPTEYRTKDGKPKALFYRHKKDVVTELAFFCRFQKLIGVDTKEELVYHMACFLGNVVKLYKNVFPPTKENVKILTQIAERILKTECSEDTLERLKDDRGYCIDPERLKKIDESTRSMMRNKGTRFANYLEIKRNYDESQSKSKNAILCGVSEATIARFRRDRDKIEQAYNTYYKTDD